MAEFESACPTRSRMRILQVPFHYFPDAVGGTEVYVSSLAKRLIESGVDVEIAAPGDREERYFHDGIHVHRFAVRDRVGDVSELYGEGDPEPALQFVKILQRTSPDLVHLHALSPAVSLRVVREIKKIGLPIIFTYHIPGITCPRGTLLRYGTNVCDGVWGLHKCSRCVLQSHGLPKSFSQVAGSLPSGVGKALRGVGWQGSIMTALRTTELQASRQGMLKAFLQEVDQIVAVSNWVKELLVRNGVAESKIMVCRHGVTQSSLDGTAADDEIRPRASEKLQIAFIGRLYPAKGAHVMIEALLRRPELAIRLDIYSIVQESRAEMYTRKLKEQASGDSRIRFFPPVSNQDMVRLLRRYDLLAVPSQGFETGPLVVYDAFSAGIPVIGSDRGGIAELVEHGKNGMLVEASNVEAWADALDRLANNNGLLERLRAGIRPPRKMSAVAVEMLEVYQDILSNVRAIPVEA